MTNIPPNSPRVSSTGAVPVRHTPKETSPSQATTSKTEIADISFLLPLGKSHYQDSQLTKVQIEQIQKLTLRLSDYLDENKKNIQDVTEKDILALYDLNALSPQDEITAKKILTAFKVLQAQSKKDYKDYGNAEEWNKICLANESDLKNLADDLTKLSKSPFKVYDSSKFKKVDLNALKTAQAHEPQRSMGKILDMTQIKALDVASVEMETLSDNVQLFLTRNSESNMEQASVLELLKLLQESTGIDLTTQKLSNKEKLQFYSQKLKERTESLKKSVDVQKTLAVMEGKYQGLENIRMIVELSQYESDPAFKILESYYSNEQIKASLERYVIKLKNISELSLADKKSLSQALIAIKSLTEVKERKAIFFVGKENYNLRLATQQVLEINLHLDSESSNNDPIRKKAADNAKKISDHYFEIKKQAQLGLQRLGILDKFSDGEERLKAEQINLNLCGSFPGLAGRIAKFNEQEKQRYFQILTKLLKGSIGRDDFMFLSAVENSKGQPDAKTRVSVLREFAIFVKLTPGKYDNEAFQQINDSMLYLDPQDPKYKEQLAEANEALLRLLDKGIFDEIGIEASDFDIAFRLNSNFTSVYEQLGPGAAVRDLNDRPVDRKFLKFTDQIDVKNSAVLRGNSKIVEKFSEFKDGILTYREADKILSENKLIRNTPVAEKSTVRTMGRSAFSRTGEMVPGMNDAANADTINRATLQLGYWMQYVTDVSLDRVDRPEMDMRYLRKEEVTGVLNANDSKKDALKVKRELYRIFNDAVLVHPNSGDVLGMKFSELQRYVGNGEMSNELLEMFQKHVIYIPDPKNPHETIGLIADDHLLPFFEAFHIASRGSRVLFNEGAVDVRFNRNRKDKALFMYLNTIFMSEDMSFKQIVYPSLSKSFDPSKPGAQSGQEMAPPASAAFPTRPLSKEEEKKEKPKKEEKPPRTKIAPAPEGYQNMGDLRSPSDKAKA